MRRFQIEIDEAWLQRLARVAKLERRGPRCQATCILESGIEALEREYGIADPYVPPRVIEGVITAPRYFLSEPMQNDAGQVRQDKAASAVL